VDATYHFGGLNVFSDIGRALSEMARVTRVGGRVVVSDENMPIWLRGTEFGQIMMNSNPLLKYDVPLQHIPVCARDVKVEWILGGVFYLIHFTVGEGAPTANMDFEIPTRRGGTHRTRFEGQLEGVTPEAKQLAQQARDRTGKSMFRWLDDVVREAARRDLQSGDVR
jgi:SAM-dependent methyltransferase